MRPGWFAAWAPVGIDFALFAAVVALLFDPVMQLISRVQPGTAVIFTLLFVGVFIPMQVVLVLSSLWAARSRYDDDTGNQT